ncbi:MAG: KH domain-containing protein [Clostridia bacterium]|nr:KH domain-containing protein [Clostridia bacterium]
MAKVAEGIGNTYEEAVKDALSKIGLEKNQVSIEMIEEPKKRFFSILEHRTVKVRATEIEVVEEKTSNKFTEIKEAPAEDVEAARVKTSEFLNEYFEKMGVKLDISSKYEDKILKFDISGEKAGIIIGYRGENLEALQLLVSTIVNRKKENYVKVLLDVEGYRQKRVKTLEELATKVAHTVISKRRSITLEPMVPFERRVIHTTLQNNPKVKTESIGVEPYRKVVISLK